MILLTGGVGFIASNVLATLNARGYDDVLLVDVLGDDGRYRNIAKHGFADVLHPDALESFLDKGRHSISAVIHLGAISSTLEQDADKIYTQNVRCSRLLWDWCTKHLVPFVYASSAATYGDGGLGFRDNLNYQENRQYRPLNPYGWSKHVFDQFCLKTYEASHPCPPQWFGLKFFNVYGPNEYHKTGQHSVVHNLFHQIRSGESARLFKSYRPDYDHGGQLRDFVWVQDCVDVILWLLDHPNLSGMLLNVGSGYARSFNDLARSVFAAMDEQARIEYIDMPVTLQGVYQYETCADLSTLRALGYTSPMTSLEQGVRMYVQDYMMQPDQYR